MSSPGLHSLPHRGARSARRGKRLTTPKIDVNPSPETSSAGCTRTSHHWAVGAEMDVFKLREYLIDDYARYVGSFHSFRDNRIRDRVESSLREGHLWPDPMI